MKTDAILYAYLAYCMKLYANTLYKESVDVLFYDQVKKKLQQGYDM